MSPPLAPSTTRISPVSSNADPINTSPPLRPSLWQNKHHKKPVDESGAARSGLDGNTSDDIGAMSTSMCPPTVSASAKGNHSRSHSQPTYDGIERIDWASVEPSALADKGIGKRSLFRFQVQPPHMAGGFPIMDRLTRAKKEDMASTNLGRRNKDAGGIRTFSTKDIAPEIGSRRTSAASQHRRLSTGVERRLLNRTSLSDNLGNSSGVVSSTSSGSGVEKDNPPDEAKKRRQKRKTLKRSASHGAECATQTNLRESIAHRFRHIGRFWRQGSTQGSSDATESDNPPSPGGQRRRLAREPQDEHSSEEISPFHQPAVQGLSRSGPSDEPIQPMSPTPASKALESLAVAGILSATANLDRLSEASRQLPRPSKSEASDKGPASDTLTAAGIDRQMSAAPTLRDDPTHNGLNAHPATESSVINQVAQGQKVLERPKPWWNLRRLSLPSLEGMLSKKRGSLQHQQQGQLDDSGILLAPLVDDGVESDMVVLAEPPGPGSQVSLVSQMAQATAGDEPKGAGAQDSQCDFASIFKDLGGPVRLSQRKPSRHQELAASEIKPGRQTKKIDWSLVKAVRVEGGWVTIEEAHANTEPQIFTKNTIQFLGETPDLSVLGVLPGSFSATNPLATFIPQAKDSKLLKQEQDEIQSYAKRHRASPAELAQFYATSAAPTISDSSAKDFLNIDEPSAIVQGCHNLKYTPTAASKSAGCAGICDEADDVQRRNTSGTVHIRGPPAITEGEQRASKSVGEHRACARYSDTSVDIKML